MPLTLEAAAPTTLCSSAMTSANVRRQSLSYGSIAAVWRCVEYPSGTHCIPRSDSALPICSRFGGIPFRWPPYRPLRSHDGCDTKHCDAHRFRLCDPQTIWTKTETEQNLIFWVSIEIEHAYSDSLNAKNIFLYFKSRLWTSNSTYSKNIAFFMSLRLILHVYWIFFT